MALRYVSDARLSTGSMASQLSTMPNSNPNDFDAFLRRGPSVLNRADSLNELRYKVLVDGIPTNTDGLSDTRIYIWLILLDAPPINTDIYIDLVHQGSSPAYSKIRNDTFRTLATDPLFRRRVSENSLTRVLNAVAWKLHDAHEARINGWLSPPTMSVASGMGGDLGASMPTSPPGSRGGNDALQSLSSLHSDAGGGGGAAGGGTTNGSQAGEKMDYVGYVQGMNVLAAPFLYVARSEAEAFAAFDKFIRTECPGYIRGSMEGVHRGLALVDEALQICDPKLFQYLSSKRLHASIYAFPSVLTMCACTPPLPEVLQLWDFLFAYGMHLNILCIVAQLVLIRDQILSAESPNQVLRSFPPLQANKIRAIAISFIPRIPDELYERLVHHAK